MKYQGRDEIPGVERLQMSDAAARGFDRLDRAEIKATDLTLSEKIRKIPDNLASCWTKFRPTLALIGLKALTYFYDEPTKSSQKLNRSNIPEQNSDEKPTEI